MSSKLAEAEANLEPIQDKLKNFEKAEEKASLELSALKADNQRWRQRVNQLIEKHQKISPEELLKAQNESTRLGKVVVQLQTTVKNANINANMLTSKLRSAEDKVKTKEAELAKVNTIVTALKEGVLCVF